MPNADKKRLKHTKVLRSWFSASQCILFSLPIYNLTIFTKDRLKRAILKKEQKIKGYKKVKNELSEFWLVLLIGALFSASYQRNENYKMDSKFDSVYLLADSDAKIIKVK